MLFGTADAGGAVHSIDTSDAGLETILQYNVCKMCDHIEQVQLSCPVTSKLPDSLQRSVKVSQSCSCKASDILKSKLLCLSARQARLIVLSAPAAVVLLA